MRCLLAAATFAALLTVSACGGGHSGAVGRHQGGAHPGTATITIMDFGYSGNLTVEPGEHVTVVNDDSVPHTLTDKATQHFDTGTIDGGGTGSFVAPMKPGSYPFGCTIHPEMSGMLTVTG